MNSSSKLEDLAHIQVKFFTKQLQYSVPDAPYSLPSNIDIDGLSSLVNKLLHPDEADVPSKIEFDFLINNELLRLSLQQYMEENDLTSEEVLEIEYLERQSAPEPEDSLLHDDWVSTVRAKGKYILTGCYDNTLHLWDTAGEHKLTIPSHSAPVKCVAWCGLDDGNNTHSFVSGSHDQTLMIWEWNEVTNDVTCAMVCKDHDGSVDCVSVNADQTLLSSGSWDTTVKLWEAGTNTSKDEPTKKKMKTENIRPPIQTMRGHKEGVSSCLWSSSSDVISASWDHTIRTWDIHHCKQKSIIEGAKAFFSIDYKNSNGLLLASSADRHIRLYDTRNTGNTAIKTTFTSHTAWVTSVAWSKRDPTLFLSGGYDNVCKVWDIRSPDAPLFDLAGTTDRILAVDWTNPDFLMCGGVDNQLRIFKHTSTGGEAVNKK